MAGEDGQLAVVIAPDTSEEASRHFSALLAGGYHPSIDYGPKGQALANYPVLVPQAELGEAKAFLRGVRSAPTPAPARPMGMFDPSLSDRPVGPIPPWKFSETVGKAVGVIGAMLALGAAIVAVVLVLQFIGSLLKGH